jgi:REP element-mobilizing transposase RayT
MPRRSTVFAPGEYYHVINRGSLRHVLFHDAETYRIFLSMLRHFTAQCNITVIAMSLMPNHFHLLVRIEEGGDLSEFMQKLCCRFSNVVNRLLRRSGTIFQGRFLSKRVSSENYLRAVCRYIHLNPVAAGLVRNPEDYEYSTYAETIGKRSRLNCDPTPIIELFRGVAGYRAFVEGSRNDPKIGDDELLRDLAEMKLI